jgi:opacity protein-like surface antigen
MNLRKTALAAFLALIPPLLLLPATARADVGPFQIRALGSVGGPVGLIGYDGYWRQTTAPFTVRLAGQMRLQQYTPLALEISAVIPYGIGANLLTDVIQTDRVRVHLFDIGIFWNAYMPVSVSRIKRDFDLTLGAGIDVRVKDSWSLSLDYRMFLPNPVTVLPAYADFALPIYTEALRGGQLWLSVGYCW